MKKIASLLLCFLLLSVCSVTVFAAEAITETEPSEDVVITVTVPNDQTITINADGATVSLDGVTADKFTVDRQSTPKLLVKANFGRVIKKVMLDDVDVTNKLQDGYLTLDAVYMDLTLTVITEAAPVTDTALLTGDTSNLLFWCLLIIIGAIAIVLLGVEDKKKTEYVRK